MKRIFLIFSIALICGLSWTVSAQNVYIAPPPALDTSNLIWNSHMMRQMGANIAGQMAQQQAAQAKQGKNSAKTTANSAKIKNAPPLVYSKETFFVRSADFALPRKMAQHQAANKSSLDVNQMSALVQNLGGRYEASFQEENERLKMPFNDVTTAMTYYIVANYMVLNDISLLEAEKSAAVYRQVAPVFAQNPEFLKLSNDDKQALAEVLVTMGGTPALVFETRRMFGETKQAARENLARIFGNNVEKLTITENGMEF